ncbi:MAG: DUF2254 domain-containing protein, partial [bacterium]|nr:DUF2254 domain-containing protein [bacterium]
VAALAFSLTLNAVTQASSQFTPRIFRNFMRDRANQFVLGYFVSVFTFCLVVLRTIRGGDELKFVPSIAVMTGLVLAIGGVLVLIFFIHHIADSLQITTILDNITDETKEAVENLFPDELGEAATDEEKDETSTAEELNNWQQVPATNSGYVQDADVDGLLEFATENRLLIRMRRGIGQFAGTGSALVEVAADTESGQIDVPMGKEAAERISGFFSLALHRTIEQDVGVGIRQIVDIALKALSPGINDTTTAINCLDKLGEITGSLARRTMPARIRTHEGVPRVITIAPTFQEFVETAFDQIRVSGKANAAIFERMLTTLFYVAERCQSQSRRAVIETQIQLVAQFADQSLSTEYEKGRISDRVRDLRKASRL